MKLVRSFAPGNVSCIFRVVADVNPAKMHSLGFGFTVTEGVELSVSYNDQGLKKGSAPVIQLNGASIDIASVLTVVERLRVSLDTNAPLFEAVHLKIDISTTLPLGSGFGLSGAAALASALAINELFQLKYSRAELGLIAHVAEVTHLTGLGDVCGQYNGGCCLRLKAGYPLQAKQIATKQNEIYVRHFSPLSTTDILANPLVRNLINQAGDKALGRLAQMDQKPQIEFADLVDISLQFAQESNLLTHKEVCATINDVVSRGGRASMVMLGHALFATIPFAGSLAMRLGHRAAEII
jgi:pantoate kinase